ncbi:hypothetical protein ANO11243_088300 [Dothideomycetidae sp. 11243]|nr:hypothetical protein ANO11243_088300 [fungal sp. No.11243]
MALPANKVFPVQVGSKLFRLSGASISSDAPSYFTQFFQAQLKRGVDPAEIKTLYLDRDPETFRDISLHLQGYHVEPRDSTHFVKLFADAQFFSLPRLIQRLYKSDILVNIGDEEFRVSRDMFDNPGDSPNYFSLGFSVFFSTPDNVFPGLSRGGLLRPPSLHPPHIQTRSSAIFRDILHVLRGYELHIKDDEHRQALLRDARYYHLRGLEQKLVPHHKVYNASRKQEEMIMRLSDLKSAGISLIVTAKSQGSSEDGNRMSDSYPPLLAQVEGNIAYARPFVDADPLNLVFELGATDMTLSCSFSGSSNIITLSPSARVRIMSLYKILRSKMIDLTGQDTVDTPQAPPEAVIERDAHVVVDGRTIDWSNVEPGENDLSKLWMASLVEPPEDAEIEARPQECWVVNKSQWRLRVSFAKETGPEMRVVWYAVKIDAVTSEAHWNAQRGFL